MKSFFRRSLLAAFLGALSVAPAWSQMVDAAALHGKKLLFVIGEPEKDKPNEDSLVQDHLKSLGFVVTVAHETDPAGAADGQDLVVISSTANSDVLQGTYREVAVPVLTWNAYAYPYMEMTGPQIHRDYELIDPARFPGRSFSGLYGYCVSPVNPIMEAAGITRSHNFGTFYLLQTEITWGRPTMGGTVAASIEDDDGEGVLFTYEKGATMYNNLPAPARRVGFFLSSNNFHLLSAAYGPGQGDPRTREWYAGIKLFDASLRWAVSAPPTPAPYDPASLHAALGRAAAGKKLLFVGRKHAFEGREADDHMVAYLSEPWIQGDVRRSGRLRHGGGRSGRGDGFRDLFEVQTGQSLRGCETALHPFRSPDERHRMPWLAASGTRSSARMARWGRATIRPPPTSISSVPGVRWRPGLKPGPVKMINDPDVIGWGTPGRAAIVIATFPTNPEQCPLFAYEKGATLANGAINPARRVYFALDNPAYDTLTDAGHALYDAAVLWAISPPGK